MLLLSTLLLTVGANAILEEKVIAYGEVPIYTSGQNQQYYSVFFDGEGDAYVVAKINLFELGDNITSLDIEIDGEYVRVINAVQEVISEEKYCNPNIRDDRVVVNVYNNQKYEQEKPQDGCVSWTTRYMKKYEKIDFVQENYADTTILKMDLEPAESTSILFSYKVKGYVAESLGVSEFKFKGLKINRDFESARVAINVQTDYKLKGGNSQVNYRHDYGFFEKSVSSVAEQSDQLVGLSNRIQYQQGYVKQVYGLDPYENIQVEGKFSKSTFLLYKFRIIGILLCMALAVFIAIWGVKKIKLKSKNWHVVIYGLAGSLLIAASGIFIFLIGAANLFSYRVANLVWLLISMMEFIWVTTILVGLPIYVGSKKGTKLGVLTFVSIMAWLFLYIMLLVIVLLLISVAGVHYYF